MSENVCQLLFQSAVLKRPKHHEKKPACELAFLSVYEGLGA